MTVRVKLGRQTALDISEERDWMQELGCLQNLQKTCGGEGGTGCILLPDLSL